MSDSKKKLFISNLDFQVTEDDLKEMFKDIAEASSVVLAVERESKRSKGFAFVEMDSDEGAKKAIDQLNNKVVNGRPMKVSFDRGKGGGDRREGGSERRTPEHLPPIQRMQLFKRKQKMDPFMEDPNLSISYKDVAMLSKFVSERGRILSRRLTGLSAYNQRKVSKAIKRAQSIGLMPYTTAVRNR